MKYCLVSIDVEPNNSYDDKYCKSGLDKVINYFQDEALPLALEQIEAANLAYKLGGIDYIQFIQNVETAINTTQEYLKQQTEYYVLSTQLKYITGR